MHILNYSNIIEEYESVNEISLLFLPPCNEVTSFNSLVYIFPPFFPLFTLDIVKHAPLMCVTSNFEWGPKSFPSPQTCCDLAQDTSRVCPLSSLFHLLCFNCPSLAVSQASLIRSWLSASVFAVSSAWQTLYSGSHTVLSLQSNFISFDQFPIISNNK